MWLLVFFCMSPVGSMPISLNLTAAENATATTTTVIPGVGTACLNDAPNATSLAADYATSLNHSHNATSSAPVGATPLNDVPNATSLAAGAAVLELDSSGNEGAETMDELNLDMPVKEGDILIQEDRNAVQTLWPDATVPYIISDELAYREAEIKAAIKMISDVTCIYFKKHDEEQNYLKFVGGSGCASFVGCQGGAQKLFVAPVCNVGNLCHEIIHALGLHHEHTREDRDKYVTVNWANILPGKEENFKVKYGNTQSLPYDPESIMHYGQAYFSANGNPTMLPKGSGMTIGQRTHLSQLDMQRLNKLYHCA
ncbi:high choriolytic enzyme 1-like isoform X2 [Archocentrus centrarchus]|uniref:high choriolytic enzyme 1-like isoform X2 n=1 Tax=Archocentrus centrarchus TaxID=63155 RepID=UPI0011EA2FD1|nr:high choriolytic enzyme 1-like isoform X2 [Archocentrus centrarchus]